MAKPKFSDKNTRSGKKGNNKGYKQLDHAKGGCMLVGEVSSEVSVLRVFYEYSF